MCLAVVCVQVTGFTGTCMTLFLALHCVSSVSRERLCIVCIVMTRDMWVAIGILELCMYSDGKLFCSEYQHLWAAHLTMIVEFRGRCFDLPKH